MKTDGEDMMVNAIRRSLLYWAVFVAGNAAAWSAGETLSSAPEGSFGIVVIPDTQVYRDQDAKTAAAGKKPLANPVFDTHTRWIVDNLQTQRIAFVSHVGDIVDRNVPEQWEVARQALDRLHARVPYGLSLGNHDLKASGDAALFQRYFPAARFSGFPWYGGTLPAESELARYGDNVNSFQVFSASGRDFVFLHLECNAPDAALQWADKVLADHVSRRALISTHMNLGPLRRPEKDEDFFVAPKGRMQWKKVHGSLGNTPQQMWDKCFRRHANVFMVFSGDQSRTQSARLLSRNDAGLPVHEVLSDYMQTSSTRNCWLRVYRFLPEQRRIDVFTVNSRDSQLCQGTKLLPRREDHQFTLEYSP